MTLRVDVVPLVEDPTEGVVAQAADLVDLAGMARAVDRDLEFNAQNRALRALCAPSIPSVKLLLCEPVIPSRPSLRLPDEAALEFCESPVPMLARLSNAC